METSTDPRQQLAELEARILDGDDSVTATALQKARAAVELADMQAEAAQRRAHAEADAQRQSAEDAFRAEVAEAATTIGTLQDAYSAVVAALRTFNGQLDQWSQRRHDVEVRARPLGLRDEVDMLPDLSRRDWIETASKEARGHYDTGSARPREGGVLTRGLRRHTLHSARAWQQIEAAEDARATASARRIAELEEQQRLDRDADRAWRQSVTEARSVRDTRD